MGNPEQALSEFIGLVVERKMREADVSDGSRVPHGSEKHVKGAILILVLSSPSQRKLFSPLRRETRCARGLIVKPCHQPGAQPVGVLGQTALARIC